MAEKYELAYVDYKAGMKQKEIAAKYDVSINTVKSWQQRKWKEMDAEGATEKVCTPKEGMHTKEEIKRASESIPPEIEMVTKAFEETTEENVELSDVQRFFCLYFVKYLNATKAYQKAYEATYENADANAYRLMGNDGIRKEISRLKRARAAGIMLDKNDVLQKYIDIAFADMGDYVEYGTEEVPLLDEEGLQLVDENGDPRTYPRSYVRFKDSAALDNTIISEVKQGKDGVSVKLHDKMKALEVLAKYTDLLDERTKTNLLNEKAKIELIRAELDKVHAVDKRRLELEQMQLNIQRTNEEIKRLQKQNEAGDQQSTEEKLAEYFTVLQEAFTNEPTNE